MNHRVSFQQPADRKGNSLCLLSRRYAGRM